MIGRTLFVAALFGFVLWVPGLATAQTNEVVTYYHTDAIGSVRMITDANGQVVARYDYFPFGEPCEFDPCANASNSQPRRFGGKERDQETGLDYFGARYYASGTGRFTTVDPVPPYQTILSIHSDGIGIRTAETIRSDTLIPTDATLRTVRTTIPNVSRERLNSRRGVKRTFGRRINQLATQQRNTAIRTRVTE